MSLVLHIVQCQEFKVELDFNLEWTFQLAQSRPFYWLGATSIELLPGSVSRVVFCCLDWVGASYYNSVLPLSYVSVFGICKLNIAILIAATQFSIGVSEILNVYSYCPMIYFCGRISYGDQSH